MQLLGLIKENKKNLLLMMMVFCDLLLICFLYAKTIINQDKTMIATMQSSDINDQYKQLLVNTYLSKIIEASDNFYHEYYTISPTVNYYSVFVEKISSHKRTHYVTFLSNPYIGPHDTIGIDEITFSADYFGNVKLEKFYHLKSFHLPDNLKDLEKKQFQQEYYEN
jgi:hypothetical protein